MARLSAYKEPAEPACAGFDKVPGVEGAGEGAPAERAADVVGFTGEAGAVGVEGVEVHVVGGDGVGSLPGEGEDVEEGEQGHFDAEEEGGDADFDVGVGEVLRGFEGPRGGGEEGDYELWFRALVMTGMST